jgi:predicted phosphodiesterase
MTATTPKMKDDGSNNTVGAWILDIKLKKKGIEKVVPTLIPCYQTIQNDYLSVKPLSSTKEKTTHVKSDTEKYIDKIYAFIKNGTRFEDFIKEMNISMTEGYGLIETMKLYGKPIELNMDENGILTFHKKKKAKTAQYTSKDKEGLIETNLCVISDTHLGTKEQQLTLINEVYKEAHRRGIKTVLHIGDVLDGDYTQVRKEQTYQLFLRGFDEQVGYVIDMYPHIDGITTYFIQGSHDETHLKNGGATAGAWIDRCRDDMIYLGQDKATFKINNLRILMDHPGGGNAKSYSYKPQQAIEGLNPGEKPNILLQGHYHKSYYMFYRNVHSLLVPCIVNQSQFMKKMNLQNIVGAYFLKIYSDEKGNIHYFEPEEHLFSTKDLIENDYLKCKKLDIRLPKKDKK